MKKIFILSLLTITIFAKRSEKNISLNYINEPLVNIVNKLASLKGANIVLPLPKDAGPAGGPTPMAGTGTKDFYDIKVNLYKEEKVSLDEAWNLLTNFLTVSGYSIYKRKNNYQIKALSDVNKAPLPLYVNTPLNKLPDNNEQIRYIYYFKKISISNKSGSAIANLKNMLSTMLIGTKVSGRGAGAAYTPPGMPGAAGGTTTDVFDLNSSQNSLTLTNPSSQIKAVMQIIMQLDSKGFDEAVDVIGLKHATPKEVEKILTQLIQSLDDDPFLRFGPQAASKDKSEAAFAPNTKVIAMDRINSVAVIGSKSSISKVSKFINKNLDVPISEGLSLIHVKPVQYLKSSDLIKPLKAILKSQAQQTSSGFGYAQAKTATSDEIFSNVIIASEVEEKEKSAQSQTQNQTGWGQQTDTTTTSAPIIGGNNLIIAAKEREWLVINKLIDELDKPQLQVAIETLIVDITTNDDKLIAAQMRNPVNTSKPKEFNWQSTPMGDIGSANSSTLLTDRTSDGKTFKSVSGDLSNPSFQTSSSSEAYISKAVTETLLGRGSTILTFKDGASGISAIMQILDKQSNTTILSQPFVVTSNNQQANITSSETRWVSGGADQTSSSNGNVIINQVQIDAKLEVSITPRINKNGEDINLELKITANEFAGENNNKLTRKIITNSHMKNKQVLVLGGLTRSSELDAEVSVPILSKIPLVGNLFKKRSKEKDKKMLMIFISPTVIKPQLYGNQDDHTKKKIEYIVKELNDGNKAVYGNNFENLTDPVTRLFFAPDNKSFKDEITNYSRSGIYSEIEKKY